MFELLLFTGKTLVLVGTIVGAVAIIALLIAFVVARSQQTSDVQIEALHEQTRTLGMMMKSFTLEKDQFKKLRKKLKEENKKPAKPTGQIFLMRFEGDMKASQTDSMRQEITALLQVAESGDEVIVVLESAGGVVHGYGHAASQLLRIRQAGMKLTVCVDEIAASGGYLMASVAHQILAAPFAIIGSIGVVAQVPNFHRLLKKHDVDFKEYTAGEFKRTVTLFGEVTPKGEEKFVRQLEETHTLFKSFIHQFRPQLNLQLIATGEYWYGEQAIALGLIDKIQTSDDYVLEKIKEKKNIFEITYERRKSFSEKLSDMVASAAERSSGKFMEQLEKRNFL